MLTVETDDGIATLTFEYGPVNAMDLEFLNAVREEVARLDEDPDARAVVLTGTGRAFCAGVDLRRILDEGEPYTRPFLRALSATVLTVFRARVPVVAAVNGHAIAGGAILAGACDRAVCTDEPRARIGLSELAVGVPFPPAALETIRRRLGPRTEEVALLAGLYDPEEARALGLVDRVVPAAELTETPVAEARRLAAVVPETFTRTKRHLHRPVEEAIDDLGSAWENEVIDAWCSEPVRAAIADFADRTL